MTRADRVRSTPPLDTPTDTSRRSFLSQAAGVAAGGTILALAASSPVPAAAASVTPPDGVYGLIEAHRTAASEWDAFLKAHSHLAQMPDEEEELCHTAMGAFVSLVKTAPTTFAGLVAWSTYLDEVRQVDEWEFEEAGTALVATLAEALGNLTVTS